MKQYLIIIGEHPELSEKVQLALFEQGFKWTHDSHTVKNTHAFCLGVNRFEHGHISAVHTTTADTLAGVLSSGLDNGNELLLPSDILGGAVLEGGEPLAPAEVDFSITVNGVRYVPADTEV